MALTKKLGEILAKWGDVVGLVFTTVGSLFIALATGEIPCRGSTTCGGVVYKFAYVIHPFIFKIGLFLIIFGLIFQLFDSLSSRHKIGRQKAFYASFFGMVTIALLIIFL